MDEPDNVTGWRAAFAAFERLLGLESTEREQAIEKLRAQDPGLWVQVHTLLRADEQAERAAFLDQHQGNSERQQIQIGSTLGAYRIERRLGEGGMGEVWLARRADGLFETPVALKLLHLHLGQSSARERFLREGRILGELAHRHVARLLDAGILPGGQLYLAIEYVEGDRIDRWCDARQLDLPARITLFLQVCAAVSHAHAHLVVHRDIKPSNILVTPDGEAKLLDFGIAKLVEHETGSGAETELTRLGGRAMTPEYAAPEQMSGAAITVVTDVYSLGVLLYWLLSGRRPYGDAGQTYSQIERQILDAEVPPMSHWRISERSRILPEASAIARTRGSLPRKLREALKGDLDTIVGKALQKAPGRRYASVDALADDLRRHLDNQPVLARPDTFSYRVRKFGRRHRLTVAATALVTITLLGGLAGTFWQAHRARAEAARADAQAELARQQAVEAQEETQRVRKTKQFFVSIFQNADPMLRKDRAPLTVAGALDDAVNRVDIELDDDPKLQADLLNDLGEIKANSGHLTEAQAMFRRALPLQEKTLAADDPALANTLVNLGVIGRYLSEPVGELQAYMSRAVAILEQHADSEGEALANAREGLAGIYLEQHKDAEAQVLMEQMLAYARQHAGANTRQLGLALGNLGALAYHRHHYDEARRYLTECLGVLESSYGPESAALNDCLATMSELSDALGDLPATVRYAERNELVTRAVEGDHPFRARSLAMLGEARREQGRDAESESLLLQALAMYERLGLAHDLFTTASLARLRDKAHRYADVLRLADGGLTQCAKDSTLTDCRSLTELRARAQAALARKG